MPDRNDSPGPAAQSTPASAAAAAVPVAPISFWSLKPWWCQPWTILATGIGISGASWLLLQRWWITAPVVAAVLVWWWLFLVLVPAGTGSPQDAGPSD